MKTFYKVYYTIDNCNDEFVVCGNNLQEEFQTLDEAVEAMESDKKKVELFNKITKENKMKHNYKIYSYTKKLEMFYNPED